MVEHQQKKISRTSDGIGCFLLIILEATAVALLLFQPKAQNAPTPSENEVAETSTSNDYRDENKGFWLGGEVEIAQGTRGYESSKEYGSERFWELEGGTYIINAYSYIDEDRKIKHSDYIEPGEVLTREVQIYVQEKEGLILMAHLCKEENEGIKDKAWVSIEDLK